MEPEVLAELVEHEPEVPVTSGPDLLAAVEAVLLRWPLLVLLRRPVLRLLVLLGRLEARTSVAAGSERNTDLTCQSTGVSSVQPASSICISSDQPAFR